jgi:glycerate-2-kinase
VTPLADAARAIYAAAIEAVQPETLLRKISYTPSGVVVGDGPFEPSGRLVVVALGKAAPGLAAVFLARSVRPPESTFVLCPDSVFVPASVAAVTRTAAHPIPDRRGREATAELRALLAGLGPEDGVVVLLSGGASAVLAEPLSGFDGERAGELTRALLARGATIGELNTVRKHVFTATGGRLAAGCPARMLTLALSDVPGDDPATIASGPTIGDPTTLADAAAVLRRRGLGAPFAEFLAAFEAGRPGLESPKPGDPRLHRSRVHALGSNRDALAGASAAASRAGFTSRTLTANLTGEARRIGAALGALVCSVASGEPVALLAAGETTVTVTGDGCGGRSLELALAAARVLDGVPERCVLAAGTDGLDGSSPAAGAVVDGWTVGRAAARGRDASAALLHNDAWGYFAGLPEAVVTGATGTNVSDIVIALVAGARPLLLGEVAAVAELPSGSARMARERSRARRPA